MRQELSKFQKRLKKYFPWTIYDKRGMLNINEMDQMGA